MMNKIKTLKIVVVILVILNLTFLTFHFLRKGGPHPEGPRNMIISELGLSPSQITEYDDLIEIHKANIERLSRDRNRVKRKLYALLDGNDNHDHGQPELIAALGGIQVEMEAIHYEHFNRLRALCTKEQLPKFKKLQEKLIHIFSPQPPKKKG